MGYARVHIPFSVLPRDFETQLFYHIFNPLASSADHALDATMQYRSRPLPRGVSYSCLEI